MFVLILGIILIVITLLFAFQNSEVITVHFFTYEMTTSVALVILAALVAGFIIALLVLTSTLVKTGSKNRKLSKELESIKEQEENVGIDYGDAEKIKSEEMASEEELDKISKEI